MIKESEITGFFGDPRLMEDPDYVLADYLFATTLDPRLAAASLCSEQSTAQWVNPFTGGDLRIRYGAKVVSLHVTAGREDYTCRVRIAYPHIHFGTQFSLMFSALAGEGICYCPGISEIKWLDVRFPRSYLKAFPGPQFGLEGIRKKLQVFARPITIGVIKPNLGLLPKETARLAYQAFLGGLDIAKDDEMMGDVVYSPLEERTREISRAKKEAERETGKPKMYIANVTVDSYLMDETYRKAADNGADGVLVNGHFAGFGALHILRRNGNIPLMGHFTGQALFDRWPTWGIDGAVLIKLQRLAGCDMIVMPGFGERMRCTEDAVLRNIAACLEDMGNIKKSLAIPGGSDSAGTLESVYRKIGCPDFGFIAGRGIFGHAEGPLAGARSITEVWAAIRKNIRAPLKTCPDTRRIGN